MKTKLTLKLDKSVIEKAKEYASSQKVSLSRIVESYLKALTIQKDQSDEDEIQISPFVKIISSGVSIPADLDYKAEYSRHLTEKYK